MTTTMRGHLGALLPRQSGRRQTGQRRYDPRGAALRYAAWEWPVGPDPLAPATTDAEQVFAAWTRHPDAPVLAECGRAFDAVAADAALVRLALARLDRLGVPIGPVVAWSGETAAAGPAGAGTIAVLVRAGSAASIDALLDRRPPGSSSPLVIGRGSRFELPASLDPSARPGPGHPNERYWLRPPSGARPMLPAAHVILGALALVPYRTFAATPR